MTWRSTSGSLRGPNRGWTPVAVVAQRDSRTQHFHEGLSYLAAVKSELDIIPETKQFQLPSIRRKSSGTDSRFTTSLPGPTTAKPGVRRNVRAACFRSLGKASMRYGVKYHNHWCRTSSTWVRSPGRSRCRPPCCRGQIQAGFLGTECRFRGIASTNRTAGGPPRRLVSKIGENPRAPVNPLRSVRCLP